MRKSLFYSGLGREGRDTLGLGLFCENLRIMYNLLDNDAIHRENDYLCKKKQTDLW